MIKWIYVVSLLFVLNPVFGYELGTHARITQNAYLSSVLNSDPGLLRDLGIAGNSTDKPFGTKYLDVSGGRIEEREGKSFATEDKRMPNVSMRYTIAGWLMRGAIREDDYLSNFNAKNPQDDPYGNFNRPLNHFYDPINNEGLSAGPVGGDPAPNWATGSAYTFADPPMPDSSRRNHFTVLDAREALFRALTGKDRNWQTVAATKTERDKYWATVFRALGDVVHLVQDMGQPQHTRNDPHSGTKYDGFAPLSGHKSVYEAYIEARAKQEFFVVESSQTNGPPPPPVPTAALKYTGYPIPAFDDYASYFSTWHLDGADPLVRRGLADYSNRGFFTAGTNFGNTGNYLYPDPNPNASVYQRGFSTADWNGNPIQNAGVVEILRGVVPDTLTGGQDKAALSTFGLWDQFLVTYTGQEQYTLTRSNYDDMADLLIPRAVAYSAGVINRFFRGRMEILIDQYSGQSVTLKFVNRSKIDTLYHVDGLNELSVVYRYRGANGEVFGTSEAPVSLRSGDDTPPGSTSAHSYTFTFSPPIPNDVEDLTLQLVYRGKLGKEEDAVAIGAIDMTSPGFIFTPNSTPADGIDGSRYIYRENGQWMLSAEHGLAFGNIDWKGWYVDGKPTQVLSWEGPASRYFPSGGGFTANIYHDGALFSVAPYPVLGAAMTRDAGGSIWLVAICQNGNNDIVLKRPFTQNTAADLYDPDLYPAGWRVLAEFSPQNGVGAPDRPWFFNGSGTEAQTMRTNNAVLSGGLERLKIRVTDDSAAIDFLGNHAGEYPFWDEHGNGCVSRFESNINCATGGGYTINTTDDRYTGKAGWTGKYIVAVDYIDEQETLATLSRDDLYTRVKYSTIDERKDYICRVSNSGYDDWVSESLDRKNDAIHSFVETSTLSLSGGKISNLIINQLDDSRRAGRPDNGSHCDMHPMYDYSNCVEEDHIVSAVNKKETRRRIEFMDIRSGVAFTTTYATEQVYLRHEDDSDPNTPPVVDSDETTTTSGYDLWIGGERNGLYSNSSTRAGIQYSLLLNPDVSSWNLATDCTRQLSGEDTTYRALGVNANVPVDIPLGSVAIDASGNVFAAIQYRDANGDLKFFNFLTNGNAAQITGISDPNVSFYPVGLR